MLDLTNESDYFVCEMEGVSGGEGPVSVRMVDGRLVVRGINEGGFSCVDIDLKAMVQWLFRMTNGDVNADTVSAALKCIMPHNQSDAESLGGAT